MSRQWPGPALLLVIGLIGVAQGLVSDLSFDELIQYDTLLGQNFFGMLEYIFLKDHQFPLLYILLHPIVQFFHDSEVALFTFRALTILFSIGSLLLFYQLTAFFIQSSSLRLLGVAILGSSQIFVTYSYSARPYSAMLFFTCYLILSLLRVRNGSTTKRDTLLSIASFVLLSLCHYFGLLYGVLILLSFLGWDDGRRRKVSLALSSFLILTGFIAMGQMDVAFLPQRNFPSMIKLLGGASLFLGGPIGAILIACFSLRFYKHLLDNKNAIKVLILFLLPIGASLLLSLFWIPLFEYRFFIPSILFSTFSVIYLIQLHFLSVNIGNHRSRVVGPIIVLFIIQALYFMNRPASIEIPPESKEMALYLKESQTSIEEVTFCGNCPSFYFGKVNLSCRGGWDFSEKGRYSSTASKKIIIYTMNDKFCSGLVSQNYQKIKRLRGIDIYQRSSVSR